MIWLFSTMVYSKVYLLMICFSVNHNQYQNAIGIVNIKGASRNMHRPVILETAQLIICLHCYSSNAFHEEGQ